MVIDEKEIIKKQLNRLIQLYKEKNWDTFFLVVDGHKRQEVFGLICNELPPHKYWEILGRILMGESFYNDELINLITNKEKDLSLRHLMMDKKDREKFEKLPDKLTLYRGQGIDAEGLGWSWSLSRDVAVFFAKRFPYGEVLQGESKKSDVIAYFTGRNEDEIVVPRESVVNVRKIEETKSEGLPTDSMFFKDTLSHSMATLEQIKEALGL